VNPYRDSKGRYAERPRTERGGFRVWLFRATRGVRIAGRNDLIMSRRTFAGFVFWITEKTFFEKF